MHQSTPPTALSQRTWPSPTVRQGLGEESITRRRTICMVCRPDNQLQLVYLLTFPDELWSNFGAQRVG